MRDFLERKKIRYLPNYMIGFSGESFEDILVVLE